MTVSMVLYIPLPGGTFRVPNSFPQEGQWPFTLNLSSIEYPVGLLDSPKGVATKGTWGIIYHP